MNRTYRDGRSDERAAIRAELRRRIKGELCESYRLALEHLLRWLKKPTKERKP